MNGNPCLDSCIPLIKIYSWPDVRHWPWFGLCLAFTWKQRASRPFRSTELLKAAIGTFPSGSEPLLAFSPCVQRATFGFSWEETRQKYLSVLMRHLRFFKKFNFNLSPEAHMLSNIEGFHISNQLSRLTHMVKFQDCKVANSSVGSPTFPKKLAGFRYLHPNMGSFLTCWRFPAILACFCWFGVFCKNLEGFDILGELLTEVECSKRVWVIMSQQRKS